jgi:hypothetical protein
LKREKHPRNKAEEGEEGKVERDLGRRLVFFK